MKLGFRKFRYSWFAIFCLAAILAVVVSNVWLVSCGRCVANDFLRVPPVGWVIIFANLLGGIILLLLKRRHPPQGGSIDHCGNCHAALREQWNYCPACGSAI